jgi:hypothetical protein
LEVERVNKIKFIINSNDNKLSILAKASIAHISDIIGKIGLKFLVLKLKKFNKLTKCNNDIRTIRIKRHIMRFLKECF